MSKSEKAACAVKLLNTEKTMEVFTIEIIINRRSLL